MQKQVAQNPASRTASRFATQQPQYCFAIEMFETANQPVAPPFKVIADFHPDHPACTATGYLTKRTDNQLVALVDDVPHLINDDMDISVDEAQRLCDLGDALMLASPCEQLAA